MPGAFKLDHLQPTEPLFLPNFHNFFTFILGGQFLLPQRANKGKRENHTTPKLDETKGFQCLEHSNWTICSLLSQFCFQTFFQLFTCILGSQVGMTLVIAYPFYFAPLVRLKIRHSLHLFFTSELHSQLTSV